MLEEEEFNGLAENHNGADLSETLQTKIVSQLQRHIEEATRLEDRER